MLNPLSKEARVQNLFEWQGLVSWLCAGSVLIVPLIALWAVGLLYTLKSGMRCHLTECVFFFCLMIVAISTIRTVAVNDSCWLQHTAALGVMVVAGALRKPSTEPTLG